MTDDDSRGQRFLQATSVEFEHDLEHDLEQVFEDRLEDFTPDVFERTFSSCGLELENVRQLKKTLSPGSVNCSSSRRSWPRNSPGSFCQGVRLEQEGHMVRLELEPGSSSLKLPELASGNPDNAFQRGLRARLAREGLVSDNDWPDEYAWLLVHMHEASGTLVGLDVLNRRTLKTIMVDTMLWHDDANWCFPRPRPVLNYGRCEHVQLFLDGSTLPESHTTLVWGNTQYEVETVTIPMAPHLDREGRLHGPSGHRVLAPHGAHGVVGRLIVAILQPVDEGVGIVFRIIFVTNGVDRPGQVRDTPIGQGLASGSAARVLAHLIVAVEACDENDGAGGLGGLCGVCHVLLIPVRDGSYSPSSSSMIASVAAITLATSEAGASGRAIANSTTTLRATHPLRVSMFT